MDNPHLFCSVVEAGVCYDCKRKKIMRDFYFKVGAPREEDAKQTLHCVSPPPAKLKERTKARGEKSKRDGDSESQHRKMDSDRLANSLPNISSTRFETQQVSESSLNFFPSIRENIRLPQTDAITETHATGSDFRLPRIEDKKVSIVKSSRKRDMKKSQLRRFMENEMEVPSSPRLPVIATDRERRCFQTVTMAADKQRAYENMTHNPSFQNLADSILNDMEDQLRKEEKRKLDSEEENEIEERKWRKLLTLSR